MEWRGGGDGMRWEKIANIIFPIAWKTNINELKYHRKVRTRIKFNDIDIIVQRMYVKRSVNMVFAQKFPFLINWKVFRLFCCRSDSILHLKGVCCEKSHLIVKLNILNRHKAAFKSGQQISLTFLNLRAEFINIVSRLSVTTSIYKLLRGA